jgi:acarbose 7IV-phosphotransferase
MSAFLLSGLINIETTLKVAGFPLAYFPVTYPFFGIRSTVSGVGLNIAKALTRLGDRVTFLSLIGRDLAGEQVRAELRREGIDDRYVLERVEQTAQSVILYESSGRRQIHVDLKDIQQQAYPPEPFEQAAAGCDLLVLCNINFSRPLLARARALDLPVASDVHALAHIDDEYNADFMAAADILFLSHESLQVSPEEFAARLFERYPLKIVVIGLGAQGALLAVRQDGFLKRYPAVVTRPVVNTIGAGDALFSAFLHGYARSRDPYHALERAMVFASYKIGAASAAEGFLDEAGLEQLSKGPV